MITAQRSLRGLRKYQLASFTPSPGTWTTVGFGRPYSAGSTFPSGRSCDAISLSEKTHEMPT